MADAELLTVKGRHGEGSPLYVYEEGEGVPFRIKRVFTVASGAGEVRGNHAHRECTQMLVCVAGKIRVHCDNGTNVSEYLLSDMGSAVLVRPGNWCRQEYLTDGSTLMVLCDRGYEPSDYIRDYDDFKKFRKVTK